MSNSMNETQDQGNNNGTEDSPAMTIEFLRARLLSERSVSRAARQRADELAKRVMELEEQLKIVSLQRKKAEKATANVLAILENHGISDESEAFDSSSDQDDTICESNNGNDTRNGEETSISIRVRDMPAYSSSEIESSPSTGRNLSWKSSKRYLNSFEQNKFMDSARRKCTSSAPYGSAPKRIGKSCRRIRRREIRSAVEGLQKDSSAFHHDASTTSSEGLPNCNDIQPQTLEEGPCHLKERDPLQDPVLGVSLNQGQVADGHFCSGDVGYEDMEGALQHQEQLIGQFEAEEKAQREWEEKFTENKSCSPDLCDPGSHSDVTEERDDVKATGQPCAAPATNSPIQDAKSVGADICSKEEVKTPKNLSLPPHGDISLQERERSSKVDHESLAPDSGFPLSRGIHRQVQPENHNHTSRSHYQFAVSSGVDNSSQKSTSSVSGSQVALVPHETTKSVGSVLEALQQAKLSLKQKFDGSQLVECRSPGRATESFIPATKTGDRMEIPPGCPGLFRLPIDIQFETTSKASSLGGTASRLSLASYYPEDVGNKLFSSLRMEPKSSTSAGDQFRTVSTSSAGSISVAHLKNLAYEPTIDAGLPSSTRFTNLDLQGSKGLPFNSKLMYPSYPFCPDVTPHLPFSGGFPASLHNKDVGVHSASRLSLHDDHKALLPPQTRLSFDDDHKVGLPPSTHLSFYDHIKPNLYR